MAPASGSSRASGDMAERIRNHDWSRTPLGPRASWPHSLKTLVDLMLKTPQLATLAVRPDRIFLYNDHAAQHYGARHPGILGRPLAEAFPHEFDQVAPFYDRVFAGESLHVPAQPLDPAQAGAPEVFDAYLTPVCDDAGLPIAVYMTGIAAGARVRAESALRASEARLSAAFESVPVGVAVLDNSGQIVLANQEYRRFLPSGLIPSRDPEHGWRWQAWDESGQPIGPDGFPGARAIRGEHVTPGMEMLYTDDDGREIWTRVASIPIVDAAGLVTAQASVVSNIDAIKRNEQALRASEAGQAALLKLSDVLRTIDDPAEIRRAAMRLLGEHLGLARVYYFDVVRDDDGGWVHVIERGYQRDPAQIEFVGPYALRDFGSALFEGFARGDPIIVDDIEKLAGATEEQRAAYRAVGVGAFVNVPLLRGEEYVAGIGAHDSGPRAWKCSEIELIRDVASRAWTATERARAEAAQRASEERLRQFGEASQDILWIRDASTLQWVYLTPAFEQIYGLSREEALTGDNYRNWQDLIVAEDRDHAVSSIGRVRAGEHVTFEYRVRRPSDGTIRWLRNTDFPITDDSGTVALIGGIGHDFTEVREAELRFRTLVEGIPQLVWRAVDGGEWTWASPQWTAYTGQEVADYRGWSWLAALHPDDREPARAAWLHTIDGGGFAVEYRIRQEPDGEYRWFQTRATPVRDRLGNIVEWLGTSTDIHELRRLQELQKTLLAELQHRVRNVLAVTRSIVSRSDDGERGTEDYVQHLLGRLSALARTQVLLTRKAGADVDLEDLIRDELVVQVASSDQFALSGPNVQLSSKAAEVLTLAIHELATNATKYGAFAHAGGRLDIRWKVETRDGQPWLVFDWIETGVPIVDAAPRRRGFGAELISMRIPYELKGNGRFELRPGGLESHIDFPLIADDTRILVQGIAI